MEELSKIKRVTYSGNPEEINSLLDKGWVILEVYKTLFILGKKADVIKED